MLHSRFSIERRVDPRSIDTLSEDVRQGLFAIPKRLPSKHLYDEEGGRLFEEICTLPEYYPTRTERALLEEIADDFIGAVRPTSFIELGSGSSDKTCLLLDAMGRRGCRALYVPLDVNEALLVESAQRLLIRYPWLSIRGEIADFEQPLVGLPRGPGVLVAFLGGTVGNLEPEQAHLFLERLARATGPGAALLLGIDRVKDPRRIRAAYDDSRGVTARFNLNLLRVLNRKLGADFDLAAFRHAAVYDEGVRQVEMRLLARHSMQVRLPALELCARFYAGEPLRTEISRKFTPSSARELLESSGWRLEDLFAPPSGDFSLAWATARPEGLRETSAPLASPPTFF